MARKSGRKIIQDEEPVISNQLPTESPRKSRKGAKVEEVEAVAPVTKGVSKKIAVNSKKSPTKVEVKREAIETVKESKIQTNCDTKATPAANKKNKRKSTVDEEEEQEENTSDKKVPKKRKTKEEKEAETMPLASRTAIAALKRPMYIGAHVSAAGGVQNSLTNASQIGANAFALFLKSQRKWTSPPLAPESRDSFHALTTTHAYDPAAHILPHGSYLVNLAAADPDKAAQAYECFLDDLQRCEALGIKLYNFHPGNTNGLPRAGALARIAANLNKAHKATNSVVTVLENMAGTGNTVGSTFEDLRDIIALVDDKSRVGVCIDTCHTFAAGYDLRTPEKFAETMAKFDAVVGTSYLKALHLNDSKAPFASHRDLHANIGTGFLGLRAFHNVMNYPGFEGLPMVLETPIEKKDADGKVVEDKSVWAGEIKLLESLIGMDVEGEGFEREERRLSELGVGERAKFQGQVDKKVQRTLDSMFKKAKKKKKSKGEADDDEDSDGGCSH